jgi:fatty-acyl-CoA synthase
VKLSYAKGPDEPSVRDITIGQALAEAAAKSPDQVALVAGDADPALRYEWTYAELYQQAQSVARALLTQFEPGDRVAVWAPNIPPWIFLEYGCALAGVVLVTVNPSFQAEELAYVLKQSRSAGIFLVPEFRGNRMMQHLESVREECPALRHVVRLDEWQDFVATAKQYVGELPQVQADDACMIQYTSGTTGFPKGALLRHKGLINNAAHTSVNTGASEQDTALAFAPLFHTAGCVCVALGALCRRSKLVLIEAFDPGLVLELLETYGANSLLGVPTMFVAIMEHPDFKRRDLSTLEVCCAGGASVPGAMIERIESELGVPFTVVFGQTESSPVSSMTHPEDTLEDKANTIGGPMPGAEIKIINPETAETVPVGELGEYCTRGYLVMLEYFELPEATAKTIDEDGWLHTGDLCSMDERGYCKVEGRLKDMIIRGGENIYPRQIEEVLFKHKTIGDVAVVGLPDDRMGEEVGAFIRPAPGESIDREELFAYLREHLSPQKTPRYWFEVNEYPMTGSGKIQKFALRQQWQEGLHQELG